MKSSFRLVTYNIHRAESTFRRKEVLDAIHTTLEKTDADILCLQEDIKSSELEHSSLTAACRDKWGNAVFEQTVTFPKFAQGNTILTHLPVKRSESIDLSVDGRQPRCAIFVEVGLESGQHVGIVCVHLGLRHWERRAQIKLLQEKLRTICSPDLPLALAGDFNDWMRTLSLSLQGSDLKLATNGKVKHPLTFPAFLPLLSLDRVYYKGLALEDFGVLNGRWGKSDHLPLVADFSLH